MHVYATCAAKHTLKHHVHFSVCYMIMTLTWWFWYFRNIYFVYIQKPKAAYLGRTRQRKFYLYPWRASEATSGCNIRRTWPRQHGKTVLDIFSNLITATSDPKRLLTCPESLQRRKMEGYWCEKHCRWDVLGAQTLCHIHGDKRYDNYCNIYNGSTSMELVTEDGSDIINRYFEYISLNWFILKFAQYIHIIILWSH